MKPYIKGTLCALMFCCAANAADTAAPALTMPQQPEEKLYFDMNLVNVSFDWMHDLNDSLSVDDLMGATLSLGQSFGETSRHYHTMYARTGYLFGSESKDIPGRNAKEWGSAKVEQIIIPITLGYTFHYKYSDQLNGYIGAQAGFHYSLTSKESTYNEPSQGSNFRTSYNIDHTKFAPTLGLEIGAVYKFSKRISWDLGINFNFTKSLKKENFEPGFSKISKEDAFTTTIHTGILITF